jgi:uncharacterized protein (TIGR02996 family)
MSDRAALLRAILVSPADDAVRLVYADWLEEHGGPLERMHAEFIRLGLEVARLEARGAGLFRSPTADLRYVALKREEPAYHGSPGTLDWMGEPLRTLCEGPPRSLARALLRGSRPLPGVPGPVLFRRGFVAEVTCPVDWWLEHAGVVCACQPVEGVTLADKAPSPYSEVPYFWRWFDASRGSGPGDVSYLDHPDSAGADEVPGQLWECYVAHMTAVNHAWEHPSREHALQCLSAACVSLGATAPPSLACRPPPPRGNIIPGG